MPVLTHALALVTLSMPAWQQPAATADPAPLVRQLGEFPAAIGRELNSRGTPVPLEQRRGETYRELRRLGPAAVPALTQGLSDGDVRVRRGVALYLSWTGGNDDKAGATDVAPFIQPLIAALRDPDQRVQELSAQAIGHTGAAGAAAVPELVGLLADPAVGLRNSACIGLGGIGPAAREALPALRRAQSDPDSDVRRFAEHAIARIDR
jgi:HEAT repeat protein